MRYSLAVSSGYRETEVLALCLECKKEAQGICIGCAGPLCEQHRDLCPGCVEVSTRQLAEYEEKNKLIEREAGRGLDNAFKIWMVLGLVWMLSMVAIPYLPIELWFAYTFMLIVYPGVVWGANLLGKSTDKSLLARRTKARLLLSDGEKGEEPREPTPRTPGGR